MAENDGSTKKEAAADAAAEKKIFGVPLATFVKGGTTTTAHDQREAREWHEAEQRRDLQDAEMRVARKPIDQGGGEMFTSKFLNQEEAQAPEAHVLLDFVNRRGEPLYEQGVPLQCLADITVATEPAFDGELVLLIMCPKCMERTKAQNTILQLRQANRMWHLDQKGAGELFVFEGEPYYSAGTVMDSERFTCAQCSWAARIDKNKIWPA
jgi:hypothetical protein